MEALGSLGIDLNGLVLHLLNFGILLAVLLKFFYKPVMKAVDERRASIAENLEQAETLKAAFEQAAKDQEAEKEAAVRAMQTDVAAAKRFGEEKAKALLADAEGRKEELISEARAIIQEMKDKLEKEVEGDVKARMERVITQILREDVPEAAVKKSVDAAWKEVSAQA